MAEPEKAPEETGDDKPTAFYESEEAKHRSEAGLEAELRKKKEASLSESIGEGIGQHRQDENHSSAD